MYCVLLFIKNIFLQDDRFSCRTAINTGPTGTLNYTENV